jgi:hypothetical protein
MNNKAKSKIRARVEHVFGAMNHFGGINPIWNSALAMPIVLILTACFNNEGLSFIYN